jgi:uncharacterized protein YjbI with pentapeptide repeats
MEAKELSEVLQKHELWLQQKDGGERADLQEADLRGADLRGADLHGADLHGADLDFSSFPLWCGSFDIKVDERLPIQLIYHIAKMDIQTGDEDLKKLINSELFIRVANKFHRVDECGRV